MMEVDNACCTIMGIDPKEVKHLDIVPVNVNPSSLPLKTADPPFLRPGPFIRYGAVHTHITDFACTSCQIAFSRFARKLALTPDKNEEFQKVQAKYPQIELYMGKVEVSEIQSVLNKNIPVILFGNCMKKIAQELNVPIEMNLDPVLKESKGNCEHKCSCLYVKGCPHDHNEAIDALLSLK